MAQKHPLRPIFCGPGSVAQSGSAFGAAAGQDLAAVGGGHSLAEAADLGAVALLGLVGTNGSHVVHLLIRICSTAARGGRSE